MSTDLLTERGQFRFTCSGYAVECTPRGLPLSYASLKRHASLAEEFELRDPRLCCVTVRRSMEPWPFLLVAQSFSPAGGGFEPCALLAADTRVLFLAAGQRVLAYRLEPVARLWEESVDGGALSWDQHGDTVLLATELVLAAWTSAGARLWSAAVEPPWDYAVRGDTVELEIMGHKQSFPLRRGPQADAGA